MYVASCWHWCKLTAGCVIGADANSVSECDLDGVIISKLAQYALT